MIILGYLFIGILWIGTLFRKEPIDLGPSIT